ncbi:hypothetical protein EX30DRAFT_83509 [Ascodesmis nigricans]|uniref:Uncharacterized protein n=1 Tax=Ascodesmis nigricans TaxID=341454 RepID=A0A4S2N355_9PEZI|nr:hypothetical protein EX30DRAFT_83509 [Ascodesmis nigricans]
MLHMHKWDKPWTGKLEIYTDDLDESYSSDSTQSSSASSSSGSSSVSSSESESGSRRSSKLNRNSGNEVYIGNSGSSSGSKSSSESGSELSSRPKNTKKSFKVPKNGYGWRNCVILAVAMYEDEYEGIDACNNADTVALFVAASNLIKHASERDRNNPKAVPTIRGLDALGNLKETPYDSTVDFDQNLKKLMGRFSMNPGSSSESESDVPNVRKKASTATTSKKRVATPGKKGP